MSTKAVEFGYYPIPVRLRAGPITIEPLPDLAQTVAEIEANEGVERGWIYAPPQEVRSWGGKVRTLPYACRVFGLPKTHVLKHSAPEGGDHLGFHLWALSFFTGMRLTATERGFVDATPIEPGRLNDFGLTGRSLEKAVELAESFWAANTTTPKRPRLWSAAVNALFLGQNPRLLQYEAFVHLYMAFDACFKAVSSKKQSVNHGRRVAWMCNHFAMPTPAWAIEKPPLKPEVAVLRNAAFHEALFIGEPLGFAVHGVGTNVNLMLEMEALICRFLVALIGGAGADYVRSLTDTRQQYLLKLT